MFSELSRDLLPIYLNDHLAAETGGCELARRAAAANHGTEMGDFLAGFAAEAEAHKAQLEDVMARLGVRRDDLKVGAGWVAEKFGRLKLNGRFFSYSPLSRVVELEAMLIGCGARELTWRTLAAAAPDDPRISDIDFADLLQRNAEYTEALREHHAAAIAEMLAAD